MTDLERSIMNPLGDQSSVYTVIETGKGAMFLKSSAILAIVLALGLIASLTHIETQVSVAESEPPLIESTGEVAGASGDSLADDPAEAIASIFGLALWPLLFLVYLLALTLIDKRAESRR